jgi:electron transfer flavoprotein alpha/beta subunit
VTCSYEVGALREPGVEAFMTAGKKPMTVWNAQQLELSGDQAARVNITNMYQPPHEGKCEMIDGSGHITQKSENKASLTKNDRTPAEICPFSSAFL